MTAGTRTVCRIPTAHDIFAQVNMVCPFRVLCLHDGNSNARDLKDKLDVLGRKLFVKHNGIDLVYINSPLANGEKQQQEEDEKVLGVPSDAVDRVWWWDSEDKKTELGLSGSTEESKTAQVATTEMENPPAGKRYPGLDASLLLLRQIWTSSPFSGVIGIGQGAAVASLLVLLLQCEQQEHQAVIPPPSFAVFLDGATLLDGRERLVDEEQLQVLHINTSSTKASSSRKDSGLVEQFGGTVVHTKRPFRSDALNAIGRFICHQRQRLSLTPTLALHSELARAEQDVTDLLARHIEVNPPAPLLAVIHPQYVGAWQGDRRAQGAGGGAPCPSTFVLPREKRKANSDDPNAEASASRVHPVKATEMRSPPTG